LPQDWKDHLGLENEDFYNIKMPSWLDSEFFAYNVFAPNPVLDESLLGVHNALQVTETDFPEPPESQWLKTEIMSKLVVGLTSMVLDLTELHQRFTSMAVLHHPLLITDIMYDIIVDVIAFSSSYIM
jgi:hypothetical protein